jgi:hypothetical protein
MSAALREENPTMADQFIAPIIPQWMEAFIVILNHNVQGDAEKKTEEYGLKMEVVKCIRFISSEFPKYVVSLLPQLFEPVWTNLHGLKEPFVQEYITDSGDIAETYQDSDGNEVGMQNFLYALNDFIGAAAPKKSVRHLFVSPETGAHTSFFEELLYIYIVFMQITQDQMETWSGDANQYVADEEDGTYTFNSRVAAVDVLVNLQDAFPAPFFNALFVAVQRHVAESKEARNAGSGEWWKIQESCLLAIGRLSEDLTDLLEDKAKNVQFDLKSLFDHVVLEDMQASSKI